MRPQFRLAAIDSILPIAIVMLWLSWIETP